MRPPRPPVRITVRYFAAARAAAGTDAETMDVDGDIGVAGLTQLLSDRRPRLATVLARCSFLRDGVAVRDLASALHAGQTIDVLPPFAGG